MKMLLTVLVVDDIEGIRIQLKMRLEAVGYRVIEASNGHEAIEAASRDCPDLIIMDRSMPLMDGFTASRRIREKGGRYGKIPILALSADSSKDMKAAAIQAGCNDYFNKLTEVDQLISAIASFLRTK